MYRASYQYKQIAEKFNLSPEHPGMDVAASLEKADRTPSKRLATAFGHWYLGPRFFERPLNEGCLEKALTTTKYAAAVGIIALIVRINRDYKTPVHRFLNAQLTFSGPKTKLGTPGFC